MMTAYMTVIVLGWVVVVGILLGRVVAPIPPLNFAQLEQMQSTKLANDTLFIKACQDMAGYYKDNTRDPSLAKILVIVELNYGYRDFYHNFKCHADRLGIKFLAIAADRDMYNYLQHNQYSDVTSFMMPNTSRGHEVNSGAHKYGSTSFNMMSCRKIEAVYGALALGYDVVFSDVDIAIVSDPIDYLFFPGVDHVYSQNKHCGQKWSFNDKSNQGNTGFYSIKSTPQSLKIWDLTLKSCAVHDRNDQMLMWHLLRSIKSPVAEPIAACPTSPKASHYKRKVLNSFTLCPLDNCLFSAGCLRPSIYTKLVDSLNHRNQSAVTAHANYLVGREEKKKALSMAGLWLTNFNFESELARVGDGSDGISTNTSSTWTCSSPSSELLLATTA